MKRELVAESGGTTRTVVVETAGGTGALRVSIDGQVREVDARQLRPGTWSILIDHHSYLVDLEPRRGVVEFSVAAAAAAPAGPGVGVIKIEDARARRLAAAAKRDRVLASGEMVTAPIAGRIVKLHCAVGDVVAPGTSVVVLEAMKMENELIAERGGTVTRIYRQAGESVDTAEKLIELA